MGLGRAALLASFMSALHQRHPPPDVVANEENAVSSPDARDRDTGEKRPGGSEADSADKTTTGGPEDDDDDVPTSPRTDTDAASVYPATKPDDDDEHFKVKHRYTPIISGLACPFSVLLDVPGLTERWYIQTDGYTVVNTQPNPIILDVGLAVSIAFGALANIALISRFLERRPRASTLVAIVALTIHDIINVVTVITFGVIHRFNDGFTYGDAYWMSVASTVASLICNVTLVVDLVRTKDFDKNGSGLTEKQRSLVIAVMALLCYIGLGSLCFSFLIPELSYISSLYFTICTISSVGFGDILPASVASRVFSFFYDVVGLILLAFTIAIARETVIETFEASYRNRREKLAARAKAKKLERKKRIKERKERLEREMRENPEKFKKEQAAAHHLHMPAVGRGGAGARSRELGFVEERDDGVSAGKAWVNRILRRWGLMKPYKPHEIIHDEDPAALGMTRTLTAQSIVAEESYKNFKKEMQKEQAREFQLKIGVALVLFWSFWLVGSAIFHFTEGWTYFEALWFCFVFFTTIGYGDYSPKSSAGRAFFVAWAIFGIATMTLLLSVVTETWSSRYRSTITDSKVKRTIRRARTANEGGNARMQALLALEGYKDEDTISVENLPTKIVEATRGFHEHARYFMHGRTGDAPARLQGLIDATDEFDDELEKLKDEGGMAEAGAHGETRHFLFMVSYERTFDMLIEAAESLNQVFKNHAGEFEEMRRLNEEMRAKLAEIEVETELVDEGVKARKRKAKAPTKVARQSSSGFPFGVKRPPGGDGDDLVEQELIDELDQPDDEDDDHGETDHVTLEFPSTSTSRPRSRASSAAGATDTLQRSSEALDRIGSAKDVRVQLGGGRISRHNSTDTFPSLAPTPSNSSASHLPSSTPLAASSSSNPPPSIRLSRTPTLSFVEPEAKR
ncbi:hypothetical protein MNV49_007987 [Pseudohyphozyma bogoriensis]|nr:hypothetical protein MNV49_007987 [Pseudohyphozyma bogoriensis]